MKTARRIRKKITKWRKAVIEHEEYIEDPLKLAVELDAEEKIRERDIRPAKSKVRRLGQRERLARDIAEGIKEPETEIEVQEEKKTLSEFESKASMFGDRGKKVEGLDKGESGSKAEAATKGISPQMRG